MAIKKYGPTTPGRRGMTVTDYSVLSKVAPERSLLEPMKKHSGRSWTAAPAEEVRNRERYPAETDFFGVVLHNEF